MKSIQNKLVFNSTATVIAAFALVFVVMLVTINSLVNRFLEMSQKRAEEVYSELTSTSDATRQKLRQFYENAMYQKGKNLIEKDVLVIQPSFNDNSYSGVRNFLHKTFALDDNIVMATFFTSVDDEIKAWTLISREHPKGLGRSIRYDPDKKAWVSTLDESGQEILVADASVAAIVATGKSAINLVDYEVVDADGVKRAIKAYDVYTPVLPGTETDFQKVKREGQTVGFLRYLISLEQMQKAIAREDDLLTQVATRQRGENIAAQTNTVRIGQDSKVLSIVILALSAVVILIMAFIIARFTSRQFTKPILQLAASAKAIQEGNYEKAVSLKSDDEIGYLENAFEKMRTEVKSFTENLQEMVDAKTKELQEALLQLTEGHSELERLVRVLCHDVTNPVSVILLTSEMVRLKFPGNTTELQWSKVSRAAHNVMEIIENVKKLQAAKSGKLKISIQPVSLKKILDNSQFLFEDKLNKKGLRLLTSLGENDQDLTVLADASSLGHDVINNIISNAIKFSARGETIAIAAAQDGKKIKIKISDNGIGIPKNILTKIFDPNAATSRKGTDNESGTGFGMPIVKSFVELYGGRISIESTTIDEDAKSHGTAITIELDAA